MQFRGKYVFRPWDWGGVGASSFPWGVPFAKVCGHEVSPPPSLALQRQACERKPPRGCCVRSHAK
eukprot:2037601-Amphidinium_carterae.1